MFAYLSGRPYILQVGLQGGEGVALHIGANGCRGGRSGRPYIRVKSSEGCLRVVTIDSQSFLLSRSAGGQNGRPYIL